MGIRERSEAALGFMLEDSTRGAGWPVVVENPGGVKKPLVGLSNDIAQMIDPDTGQAVSGRLASIALRISSLTAAGLALPQGEADTTKKPWLIHFDDIAGNPYTFKVEQSNPDRTVGLVTCILGIYTCAN